MVLCVDIDNTSIPLFRKIEILIICLCEKFLVRQKDLFFMQCQISGKNQSQIKKLPDQFDNYTCCSYL